MFAQNTQAPHDVAWSLAWGADRFVTQFRKYIINGYRFATVEASEGMSSCNFGVCVRGGQDNSQESDYYGKLVDIIQLDYKWDMKVTLFKCQWFDNGPRGMRVDKFGNVEVNKSRTYTLSYDPFILAQQAEQVYYTSYPTSQQGWMGVIKTKARNVIPKSDVSETNDISEPFQADMEDVVPVDFEDNDSYEDTVDPGANLEMIPIQFGNDELDDEEQEISSSDSEAELDDFETEEEGLEEEIEEDDSSD